MLCNDDDDKLPLYGIRVSIGSCAHVAFALIGQVVIPPLHWSRPWALANATHLPLPTSMSVRLDFVTAVLEMVDDEPRKGNTRGNRRTRTSFPTQGGSIVTLY